MSEKKTWKGILMNHAMFQGEIVADPVFNGEYGFMTLRTSVIQRDANGQITEVDQEVPLMVEPGSPNVKVVRDFVKAGRKLLAWCQYRSWTGQQGLQHAFVVARLVLGDKPYEGPTSMSPPSIPQ